MKWTTIPRLLIVVDDQMNDPLLLSSFFESYFHHWRFVWGYSTYRPGYGEPCLFLPCFLEEERIQQDEHEQFMFLGRNQDTICLSSSALFCQCWIPSVARSRNKSPGRRQPTDVIKRILYWKGKFPGWHDVPLNPGSSRLASCYDVQGQASEIDESPLDCWFECHSSQCSLRVSDYLAFLVFTK